MNFVRENQGFTLVEMVIASGAVSLLLLLAMSVNISSLSNQIYFTRQSNLIQDTLWAADYFLGKIRSSGGGFVAPWLAIWVEDSCEARGPFPDCDGSDRLTISTATFPSRSCGIVSSTSTQLQMSTVGGCCINSAFENHQLMLTRGTSYAQVYGTAINLVNCTLNYTEGQATLNDSSPAPTNWQGGSATLVDVVTYYLDSANSQLNQYIDINGNNTFDSDSNSIALVNCFDFQVALGYDLDGNNNLVDDGSTADSWLFNSPGESWNSGVFNNLPRSQLKEIKIGLALGAKYSSARKVGPAAIQMLNGPRRQNAAYDLFSVQMIASPRNVQIIQ